MRMTTPQPIRCAIYTRKSSDEGLDQSFNSLDAQREACEAYIKSQAREGWRLIATRYDDGGLSGGTMERPALRRLLADIDAGRIDTILVYKIDRLTRSLADFARIVERLERAKASFVSVTQAFNTTSSMGRLTLNVLLSFAQFEREVTGERIRDKIAASKKRGLWMGGYPPLGYDPPQDRTIRKLAVNDGEAAIVRDIFEHYLELGSVAALERSLEQKGIRSKLWRSPHGKSRGGVALSRGALYHLLKNHLYLGEITHRGVSYPGTHAPIVPPDLFAAVQAKLEEQRITRHERPLRAAPMPLTGLLVTASDEPMSPSFAYGRGGKLYRYYVAAPLQQRRRLALDRDRPHRISAPLLEDALRHHIAAWYEAPDTTPLAQLLTAVKRIALHACEIEISFVLDDLPRSRRRLLAPNPYDNTLGILTLPIRCSVRGSKSKLIPAAGGSALANKDPVLIAALKRGHDLAAACGWSTNRARLDREIARAPHNTYERRIARLAFLAPDLQQAILTGKQPVALTLKRFLGLSIPADWDQQRCLFASLNR